MKKIKYLLLLGILTFLGIGSSFAFIGVVNFEIGGYNRNYKFYLGKSSSQYSISNVYVNDGTISNHSITSYYSSNASGGHSIFEELSVLSGVGIFPGQTPRLYYGNNFVSLFNPSTSYTPLAGAIWNFNNATSRSTSQYFNGGDFYTRLFLNNSSDSTYCLFPESSSTLITGFYGGCDINNYQIFTNNEYSVNSKSNTIYDSTYLNGDIIKNARKGVVFPGLGQGYSFIYQSGLDSVLNKGYFRSVLSGTLISDDFSTFNNRNYVQNKYVDGQLFIKLNNLSNGLITGETDLLVIDSLNTGYYMYSIYHCSDEIISNCSFTEGGKLYYHDSLIVPSFTGVLDSFYSGFNSYQETGNYLYNPVVYNVYDFNLNTITFTRYRIRSVSSSNAPQSSVSKTIQLVPGQGDDNYNLLMYMGIIGGNPSGQSSGSIALNTGFLDLCLNNLTFGELNSYLCNKLYNGSDIVLIPGQTGYYLQYGIDENGNIRFWLTYQEDLEQQMSGYVWEQDSSGNWYAYLPEVINTGIVNNPTGLKDYFHNWFENGVFFSCPFHYTDNYYRSFKLFGVMHYVPKLGDSFLMPIYCIGAGFREGKNFEFFSGVNIGIENPLLNDTEHYSLCRLIDLVLSVLILFFIIKIYHLLN